MSYSSEKAPNGILNVDGSDFDLNNLFNVQYNFDLLKKLIELLAKNLKQANSKMQFLENKNEMNERKIDDMEKLSYRTNINSRNIFKTVKQAVINLGGTMPDFEDDDEENRISNNDENKDKIESPKRKLSEKSEKNDDKSEIYPKNDENDDNERKKTKHKRNVNNSESFMGSNKGLSYITISNEEGSNAVEGEKKSTRDIRNFEEKRTAKFKDRNGIDFDVEDLITKINVNKLFTFLEKTH